MLADTSYYLAPAWIGADRLGKLQMVDGLNGFELELAGSLREAFLDCRFLQQPSAVTLARLNPAMQRLVTDLVASDPVPLTRHVLLKGTGWTRLFVELTGQCNERCAHCYAGSSPEVEQSLDGEVVIRALDEAREMGFTSVQLTGGDPLISDLCVPAARHARDLGFGAVEVYTNGLALKGPLFDALRELDVSFSFSLYGQDPLVHDIVTGIPGSHRRTAEAIERTGRAGLTMRVGIIDTGTPGFSLAQTRMLAESLGVPSGLIASDVERSVGRGDFKPNDLPISEQPAEGSPLATPSRVHGGSGASLFGGTAAVSYSGEVYPCIFSRDLPLGRVDQEGLAGSLTRELPVQVDPETLIDESHAWSDRLTCRKCQYRAAMLSV
jgi:MoaA/NifB/PqqE/SkfB family radical SAM enzyme